MNKLILLLFIVTTIYSCNGTKENSSKQSIDSLSKLPSELTIQEELKESLIVTNEKFIVDTITDIVFEEMTISIEGFSVRDKRLYQKFKDTVTLYRDKIDIDVQIEENPRKLITLSGTIQGKIINVFSDSLKEITIEESYETSPIIQNGGDNCSIINWKHFYSDWKQLQKNDSKQFKCSEYTLQEHEEFIEVDIAEFKKIVKEECGEFYSEKIKNVKTLTEYPSAIRISKYFLRISGIQISNGQKITKLIIIESPLGC